MTGSLAELESSQLLARLRALISRGNEIEADLLAYLGEVDARRLYLEEGCPSMFTYCVTVLHFAESVAYKRIAAARAARCHPELLESVRRGELHLTAVSLLAPKLTLENSRELIAAARHRSAEQIKQLLVDREPRPTPPAFVRRIPEPSLPPAPSAGPAEAALPPPAPVALSRPALKPTEPLGAQRYRVQFVADRETHQQLEELRALMRHQIPDGDLGKILGRAIAALLAQVRKQKFAETSAPRTPKAPSESLSRRIPATIRRAVWKRDAGRCTYVSAIGRRCDSRDFIEFDHADAWAHTRKHSVAGITLRCRAHNQQRARNDFGDQHMAQFARRAGPSTGFESSCLPGSP